MPAVAERLGDQGRLVERVEVGEPHAPAPGGPRGRPVGDPPQVQGDGEAVAEKALQFHAEQVTGRRVQQQDPPPPQHAPVPVPVPGRSRTSAVRRAAVGG